MVYSADEVKEIVRAEVERQRGAKAAER